MPKGGPKFVCPWKELLGVQNLVESYFLLTLIDGQCIIFQSYETRVSTSDANEIVVSVIFVNTSTDNIRNLELNVLDSLNSKFQRPPSTGGYSEQSAVKVPFALPAGLQNESQFTFSVQSLTQPQKLRGTLTYMLEVRILPKLHKE